MLFANDCPFIVLCHLHQFQDIFEYVGVENGLEAVESVLNNPVDYFDVIILDINMPIMDGFEACHKISEHFAILEDEKKMPQQNVSLDLPKLEEIKKTGLFSSVVSDNYPKVHKETVERKVPLLFALSADHSPQLRTQVHESNFCRLFKQIHDEELSVISDSL